MCDKIFKEYMQNFPVGVAQRVNGKVSGTINGQSLGTADLHAYVVTSDGRAYTAISRVPGELGRSMLSLYTIGSVFGWLFGATSASGAKNGYMITGRHWIYYLHLASLTLET